MNHMTQPSYTLALHADEQETAPMRDVRELSSQHSLYETKNRPHQDRAWSWTFLGLLALSSAWGVAAIIQSDKRHDAYPFQFLSGSTSCNFAHFESLHPELVVPEGVQGAPRWGTALRRSVALWVPLSGALGLLFSVSYILLFRRFARAMVLVSVLASLLMTYLYALLVLFAGATRTGITLLAAAVVLTAFYWQYRSHLHTVAKLLSVAGVGLSENPWVIPTAIGVKLCGLAVITFLAYAYGSASSAGAPGQADGVAHVYPGPDGDTGRCTNEMQDQVDCCQWRAAAWRPYYMLLCAATILWGSAVIMQIKLYVCADVIACWYFQPADQTWDEERPSVLRALRNGLGPSFGTVAFAAAILAAVRLMRSMLRRACSCGPCCCIIGCFARPLLALVERFSDFSTIASAVTGRSFRDSSGQVFDTLTRCSLPLWSLWWLPEMVLGATVALFSLTWSIIVFISVLADREGGDLLDRLFLALLISAMCFACVWFQASFVSRILLDVVNTIYICYAYDRDASCVTRPDVHAIYQAVVTVVGPVVLNPDGALAYGAPLQGQLQMYSLPRQARPRLFGMPRMFGLPRMSSMPQQTYAMQTYSVPQQVYAMPPQQMYATPPQQMYTLPAQQMYTLPPQQPQYPVPMYPPPMLPQPVQQNMYTGAPVPGHPVFTYPVESSYNHAVVPTLYHPPQQQQQQQQQQHNTGGGVV